MFAVVLSLCLFVTAHAADINVFAAASLTDALKQIAADYEKTSGDKVVFNFAASGTLALQIENGAPADIFFSADESKMDRLAAKGLVIPESRHDLLGNSLVIVATPDSTAIHSPGDLTNSTVSKIAIGDVKIVPAGTYAKTYLEKLGLWQTLQPKLIPCENVRAVLAAVESGNVDAGIVYKTDSLISKKVKIVFDVPVSEGPKISYPVALVKASSQQETAGKFLNYLESEAAAAKFKDGGFSVLK